MTQKDEINNDDDDTTPLKKSGNNGGTYDPEATENEHDKVDYERGLLLKLLLTTGATSATLGFDVGVMASVIQPLESSMSLTGIQKELAMGSLNFVAAFGALMAGKIADISGRKATVRWCGWLFLIGAVLMAFALNYAMLLLGRIIAGLGVGVAFVVAPVFITEIAPSEKRGALNTIFDVAINGGILAGYVVGFVVELFSPGNWRLMLGSGIILPVIILALLSGLPESPRWLMMAEKKSATMGVLFRLGHTKKESQKMVQDMEDEIERQKKAPNVLWGAGQGLAVGFGFFQQITGTEAVLYYSADFLARAGMTSPLLRLLGNCFIGICKLVPECLAMYYIDAIGRWPLMMTSAVTLFATIAGLSFAFYVKASAIVVIILLCAIMATYSIGLGPFTFLCASENLGVNERATGMTYCAAANRITSGTIALTVVSLGNLLGDAGLFGLYAIFGLASLLFYWFVPETSGFSLEEIAAGRHREN